LTQIDPPNPPPDAPPAFDIEAARARYRRQMRSRPMRALGVFTVLVVLVSWTLAIAAAYAPDVERLPGHDVTVTRAACVNCHTRQIDNANAGAQAPPMNHPATPTCGFCHVQGPPPVRSRQ
jgi:hypothetical protein